MNTNSPIWNIVKAIIFFVAAGIALSIAFGLLSGILALIIKVLVPIAIVVWLVRVIFGPRRSRRGF